MPPGYVDNSTLQYLQAIMAAHNAGTYSPGALAQLLGGQVPSAPLAHPGVGGPPQLLFPPGVAPFAMMPGPSAAAALGGYPGQGQQQHHGRGQQPHQQSGGRSARQPGQSGHRKRRRDDDLEEGAGGEPSADRDAAGSMGEGEAEDAEAEQPPPPVDRRAAALDLLKSTGVPGERCGSAQCGGPCWVPYNCALSLVLCSCWFVWVQQHQQACCGCIEGASIWLPPCALQSLIKLFLLTSQPIHTLQPTRLRLLLQSRAGTGTDRGAVRRLGACGMG